jgi:Tol biopolymer transport system component
LGKTNPLAVLLAVAGAAVVAVGLVVLMLVVEARPGEATFPGKNGKIAYVGVETLPSGYFETEIYTVKAGGGGRVRVTHNATHEELPSYSPSGKKITYNVFGENGWEIYAINAAGGKPFQVTHNRTDDGDPSWGSRP